VTERDRELKRRGEEEPVELELEFGRKGGRRSCWE